MINTKRKVTRDEFDEIKMAQENEETTIAIAKLYKITLPSVGHIYRSDTYEDYNPEDEGEESSGDIDTENDNVSALPARAGSLRSLVLKKTDENNSLTETRDALASQVRSLWKMISLLEKRKRDLENDIYTAQKYIKDNIKFAEEEIE